MLLATKLQYFNDDIKTNNDKIYLVKLPEV